MSSLLSLFIIFIFIFILLIIPSSTIAKPHSIHFHSPNLYPEGIAYDPSAQHFILGSLRNRTFFSVSDAAVVHTLISDPSLPPNTSILGLAVDSHHHRLLAAIHSLSPLPPFNALAAYDLRSGKQIFLSLLPDPAPDSSQRAVANAVAVDFKGNAYVTNSLGNPDGNFIWKVNGQGEASIFSRSPMFNRYPVNPDAPFSYVGLNGIAYVSKGYLLVVQSNTGKMFKVDEEEGTARMVLLSEDLELADGIAVRRDGVVLVVSPKKLWFLKSDDSWGEGVVYDKIDLDEEKFATSVTVGREDRAYVIYGRVVEGVMGNGGREWFDIEEVRSVRESEDENVWVFVLLGLGLAYFFFWRFQMKHLLQSLNKKTN
ncbi:NHL domain-containing protein [Euphorbia peplus]|nr:NHL domain-containing protein [Euphorbia peplus]